MSSNQSRRASSTVGSLKFYTPKSVIRSLRSVYFTASSSIGDDDEDDDAQSKFLQLGRLVAQGFISQPRFTFVGFAGLGRHGGTLMLLEQKSPEESRKVVIKYSYGELSLDKESDADEHLRNEYEILLRLRGAEHIVRLIHLADHKLNIPGISNGESSQGSKSSKYSRTFPTFALEYLDGLAPFPNVHCFLLLTISWRSLEEDSFRTTNTPLLNDIHPQSLVKPRAFSLVVWYCANSLILLGVISGTLKNFHEKVRSKKRRGLPSRLLWRMWLCMVRQCVAMAFPPDIPKEIYDDNFIEREFIGEQLYTGITQNSPHEMNFMFNTAFLKGFEHEPNFPALKLIDFGRGRIETLEDATQELQSYFDQYGSLRNLRNAAWVFLPICAVFVDDPESLDLREEPIEFDCMFAGESYTVLTVAPDALLFTKAIDPKLRDLLICLFAYYTADTPSLEEVLSVSEQAVNYDDSWEVTEEAKALGIVETDEEIQQIIQETIFDVS
ncbi:hypothetical protein GGS21DRAFT_485736 [Xylaria nigripes]|nr:hypothetical protein GGS21DRAFT_485736 [Xylaria nigripes]